MGSFRQSFKSGLTRVVRGIGIREHVSVMGTRFSRRGPGIIRQREVTRPDSTVRYLVTFTDYSRVSCPQYLAQNFQEGFS